MLVAKTLDKRGIIYTRKARANISGLIISSPDTTVGFFMIMKRLVKGFILKEYPEVVFRKQVKTREERNKAIDGAEDKGAERVTIEKVSP